MNPSEHSRQHLRALSTGSTCPLNLLARKNKAGEEERKRERERERGRAFTSRRALCMMGLSHFSSSSPRFSISVPLRLESLVLEANLVSALQNLAVEVEAVN